MTTVNRPFPYLDGYGNFYIATAVEPGMPVIITSTGITPAGATDDEYIGWADYDQSLVRDTGTTVFAAGKQASIKFRGAVARSILATTVAVGQFVKLAASGTIQIEATGATKTLNSIGIALEAGATGDAINYVKL